MGFVPKLSTGLVPELDENQPTKFNYENHSEDYHLKSVSEHFPSNQVPNHNKIYVKDLDDGLTLIHMRPKIIKSLAPE